MNKSKWIGFDLDGTLAKTTVGNTIGQPIKAMIDLLLKIHHEGKYQVKNLHRTGRKQRKNGIN